MDFSMLKRLTETPGVPGREEHIRDLVLQQLSRITSEKVTTDSMGNLIAHLPGPGPSVALIAHMDEVGFLISKIEPEGFVRVMPTGGVDRRVFWAQKVIVHGRDDLPGVVGSVPPHLLAPDGKEAEKAIPIEDCFIDLGLPAEEVKQLAKIGDPVTFATQSWETETSFFAKALDDRVGLFVMLESVRQAKKIHCDLFLIGSTQEEYGLRGTGPAVYTVRPEIVLALEGTAAGDTPGVNLPANVTATAQGKGPEIRLTDKRMISSWGLTDFLSHLATELGIPHQMVVKKTGATDAAVGQITGPGVKACTVAVPTRYIHAPAGSVLKADVTYTVALVAAFLEQASQFKGL